MKDAHAQDLARRATDWQRMAELGLQDGRLEAAYECARTACELAGKALLQEKLGRYARSHEIQGDLFRERLIPAAVNAKRLSKLLGDFTRGTYGVGPRVSSSEASSAVALAKAMVGSPIQS